MLKIKALVAQYPKLTAVIIAAIAAYLGLDADQIVDAFKTVNSVG